MAVENDKIKDLFSSKLGGFEPEVPASVWGGLDLLLGQLPPQPHVQTPDATSSSSKVGNASKSSTMKTTVLVVAIAVAVALGTLFYRSQNESKIVLDNKKKEVVEKIDEEASPEIASPSQESILVQHNNQSKHTPKVHPLADSVPNNISTPVTIEDREEQSPEQPEDTISPQSPTRHIEVESRSKHPLVVTMRMPIPKESIVKSLSLKVGGTYSFFGYNNTYNNPQVLFSADGRSNVFKSYLKKENTKFRLNHKQPISFNVLLNKQLSPRWSIESGIVYTYLSSTLTAQSTYVNIDESQNFHYLGIPVYLNYSFYKKGNTNIFVSFGGLLQKDVNGYYISRLSFDEIGSLPSDWSNIYGMEPSYLKDYIKQPNMQFSVHSALGVSYPVYNSISIYGTVGAGYYFDAGNTYRTIFSDRKTQLDLNLGVKFGF